MVPWQGRKGSALEVKFSQTGGLVVSGDMVSPRKSACLIEMYHIFIGGHPFHQHIITDNQPSEIPSTLWVCKPGLCGAENFRVQ